MPNRFKFLRSATASAVPPDGTAADLGRIAANLTDRKLWMYGSAGTPSVIATYTTLHNPSSGYVVGDLVVQGDILYRCTTDIGPKTFDIEDWQGVSDYRDVALYRNPTTQAIATITLGAAGISHRVTANVGQTAPLQEWRNGVDESVTDIRSDGYPGATFARPVFRVDQVGHPFTGVGQPARFDGTDWVLANASTPAGFANGIVRRVLSVDAFEIQTCGRIDGMEAAAFEDGTYVPNTLYYVSTSTSGKLVVGAPPNPAAENTAVYTLVDGSALISLATPIGSGSGGGDSATILINQPNNFTAIGQVAANNGAWGLANGGSATLAPLGVVSAISGDDFAVRVAGLVTGITADAAVTFPLTAGTAYYADSTGLLTATPPTDTPVAATPVLWAVTGTSGIVVTQPQSPNLLRPSQNLADLASASTARDNLGMGDVLDDIIELGNDLTDLENTTLTAGIGLTGGGNLEADLTFDVDVATDANLRAATSEKIVDAAGLRSAAAPVVLTDGATITPDFATGRVFSVTLGGNRTLANATNQAAGQSGIIIVKQDGTGSRTLTPGSNYLFAGGAPILSETPNSIDIISYYVESSGVILCTFAGGFE